MAGRRTKRREMNTKLMQSVSAEGVQALAERLEFIETPTDRAGPTEAPGLDGATGRITPVDWHGVRKNCLVNVSARASLAWMRSPGGPLYLGLLVTVAGDIHNPHVFVGIDVPFSVEVLVS